MDATTFTALAEPNRLKIIELLRDSPRSVNEIALLLQMRQPQTSKHLRVLAQTGLVQVRPAGQQRIYALNPEPFLQLDDWVGSFHRYWKPRLDQLEKHLKKG